MTSSDNTLLRLRKSEHSLEQVRNDLDAFLGNRFRAIDKNRIFLALEEALVNVFEHTYAQIDGLVEITMIHLPDRIRLELKDDGALFDPTTIPMPDPEALAESGGDGGYGLFLMRSIMQVEHQTNPSGGNLLILEKRCPSMEGQK